MNGDDDDGDNNGFNFFKHYLLAYIRRSFASVLIKVPKIKEINVYTCQNNINSIQCTEAPTVIEEITSKRQKLWCKMLYTALTLSTEVVYYANPDSQYVSIYKDVLRLKDVFVRD